jgi:hemerythrin-like metal-binding protein
MDVSHERMDREHRILFEYFQEFEELAKDTRANHEALREIIMKFLSEASSHFVFEERLLHSAGLPWDDTKAHMDDHMRVQALLLKVIGPVVRHSLDLGKSREAFLGAFITHIIAFDKPLADHVALHGEVYEK